MHRSIQLIAAPFTPMHPDGSLHLELIVPYYAMLKANRIRGAFICGSTGEGVSLSLQEKKAVTDAWTQCAGANPDFAIMVLVGGNSLTDCQELAAYAARSGVDAISFTAPSYFRPASVQALAHMCSAIAAAAPELPFYYYHIPVLTGVSFSMLSLLEAVHLHIPNFAGIKYTHEDFMDYLSCMHFAQGQYSMLWGRDENMLPALALGAETFVGSTYNYLAPLYQQLATAFTHGQWQAARHLQQKSIDLIRLLGKYGGIATGKAYMRLLGIECGTFRLPISHMDPDQYEAFVQEALQNDFATYQSLLPSGTGPKV